MPAGENAKKLILRCAGGTGGHLFPAEAIVVALQKRGAAVKPRHCLTAVAICADDTADAT